MVAIPNILKTMLENRNVNNLATPIGQISISSKSSSPGSHSFKRKIIEDTPKHKVLIEHFEAIIEKCSADDCSDSDDE